MLTLSYSINYAAMKMLVVYGLSIFFILIGLFLLRNGLKKGAVKSALMKVNHIPGKNYGKIFSIALGMVCITVGVLILFNNN